MVRLQGIFVFCLLLSIKLVEGNCRNTTLKLFDDQIQAIQKSVRTIVNEGSCTSNKGQVGFQAYMGSGKTYAQGAVYVYNKVVTNTHNAYSATTGKFVVPDRGLYIFSYSTLSNPGKESHPMLVVNGIGKSWQVCNNSDGKNRQHMTCSNTAILQLEKGDVVYVADQFGKATVREKYTDFSGAKLN